jgi:hypothetical protein
MIDENVVEAVGAKPSLQRGGSRVVFAGMAYEKYRHVPLTEPSPAASPASTTGAK